MNVWHAQNFPFLTQLLFYENGTEYDQLRILNPDYTLNYEKLEQAGHHGFDAGEKVIERLRWKVKSDEQRASLRDMISQSCYRPFRAFPSCPVS